MPKPHTLHNLILDEISLVDKGANGGAQVVLAKRDLSKKIEQRGSTWVVLSADGTTVLGTHENEAEAKAHMAELDASKDTKKSALQRVKAFLAKEFGYDMPMPSPTIDVEPRVPVEPQTFGQELLEQRMNDILGDVAEHLCALQCVIADALSAGTGTEKQTVIDQAITDFADTLSTAVPEWLTGVQKAGRKISADRLTKMKHMQQMLATMIAEQDVTKEDDMKIDVSKLAPEVQAHIAELEKSAAEKLTGAAEIAKVQADAAVLVAKAQADATEAREIAKAERDQRIAKEFTEKVSVFKRLSINKATDGAVLREIAEKCSPEVATRIDEILKSAENLLAETSILMRPMGSSQSGAGSAFGKLEAIAKELVSKGEAKTNAKAMALAMDRNPDLYVESQRELVG